jgi:sigma-B regulation protein RsbU (phosphoserine phosphatase)
VTAHALLAGELDLSGDERLAAIMAMVQRVSKAGSPLDVVREFTKVYYQHHAGDYLITVMTRAQRPGEYRIFRRIDIPALKQGTVELQDARLNPEWQLTRTGGLIGTIVREYRPRIFHHLEHLVPDDAIGPHSAAFRSAMAVPLFIQGHVEYWSMTFSTRPAAFGVEELERALLVGNLLGGTTSTLLLMQQVRDLNRRLEAEFEGVGRVQRSLLPQRLSVPGLALAAGYATSQRAGGDYYDLVQLADGRWCALVADVSGHGPGSATVMAMLRVLLHSSVAHRASGPAEVLVHLNAELARTPLEGRFVTAVALAIDPRTGAAEFAHAGHPAPLLRHTNARVEPLQGEACDVLGLHDRIDPQPHPLTLQHGQVLLLFTDGVTDAMNPKHQTLSAARVTQAIAAAEPTPQGVVDSVRQVIAAHQGQAPPTDDQTLLAIALDRD